MIEFALQEIVKYFGAAPALKGVTFEVQQGERVALLGKNGSGKSTLLRILSGKEEYDSGFRTVRKGATIGFLEQIPEFSSGEDVKTILYAVYQELLTIKAELSRIEAKLNENATDEILKKYGKLQERYEVEDGYLIDARIARIAQGLRIDVLLDQEFARLSGGEKTRVMLGRIMLQAPQILLLDEPTNHLDLTSLEWLEEYLCEYRGTLVVTSHDRYFLDRVVNRVVELEDGKAVLYEGNFTTYIREKEVRLQNRLKHYDDQQKQLRKLQEAAKRMHDWAKRADNPKMHRQAFNIEKRLERIEKIERPKREKHLNNQFTKLAFSGEEIIIVKSLRKAFEGKTVLENLNFQVHKGERVGIIGNNGSGKSTFLKIIMEEIQPDYGEVKLGESVHCVYLPQVISFEEPSRNILETVRYELRIGETEARRLLAKYQFPNEALLKKVQTLSGGEKSRLKLCLMMQNEVNLLLLDEPTNHLDLPSREWLEEAFVHFTGTMVFISHDRYFINRFATRLAELQDGRLNNFYGTYQDYREQKLVFTGAKVKKVGNQKATCIPAVKESLPAIKRDFVQMISGYEQELQQLVETMRHLDHDYLRLDELYQKQLFLEQEVAKLYQEWEKLEG